MMNRHPQKLIRIYILQKLRKLFGRVGTFYHLQLMEETLGKQCFLSL